VDDATPVGNVTTPAAAAFSFDPFRGIELLAPNDNNVGVAAAGLNDSCVKG